MCKKCGIERVLLDTKKRAANRTYINYREDTNSA